MFLSLRATNILMSCNGCIGYLNAQNSMEEILSVQFGGIKKMLTDKKYPENVWVLLLMLEELLRPIFSKHTIETMDDLKHVLEDLARKSPTTRVWVDCFVKTMPTVLKYIRAERGRLATACSSCQGNIGSFLRSRSPELCQIWPILH